MVDFDEIYSMLFTGSFEVEHGFVTAVRRGFKSRKRSEMRLVRRKRSCCVDWFSGVENTDDDVRPRWLWGSAASIGF